VLACPSRPPSAIPAAERGCPSVVLHAKPPPPLDTEELRAATPRCPPAYQGRLHRLSRPPSPPGPLPPWLPGTATSTTSVLSHRGRACGWHPHGLPCLLRCVVGDEDLHSYCIHCLCKANAILQTERMERSKRRNEERKAKRARNRVVGTTRKSDRRYHKACGAAFRRTVTGPPAIGTLATRVRAHVSEQGIVHMSRHSIQAVGWKIL
jgi:hypothetical protein